MTWSPERVPPAPQQLSVVIAGHVDHGKSTVIGRLLADTGSLPHGKLEQIRAHCERTSRPLEYAFLLDALKDEQAQGITIDAARVFFRSARRPYLILDAPGHVEFVRNLVTGAARAEAALLVIDAKDGVQENSRRHGSLMRMLGVRQLVVLVNKMDLVEHERTAFARIVDAYGDFLDRLGVRPEWYIPVVGRDGDNVARRSDRMPWYAGPTVLEALDAFVPDVPATDRPFRMPVQDVYKFTQHGDDRRTVAGTVDSGVVRVGDEVVFYPSGKTSRVQSVEAFGEPTRDAAQAGEATGLTLDEHIYVARGELATLARESRPRVTTRLRASVFWLGPRPLVTGKDYLIKLGTARVPMRVERVHRVVDAASLETEEGRPQVSRHEVGEVTLKLRRAIAFDLADELETTSRFVVVEEFDIRGGGIVREALPDTQSSVRGTALVRNDTWGPSSIPQDRRGASRIMPRAATAALRGLVFARTMGAVTGGRTRRGRSREFAPAVIWFTGLSGSGKSTIAAVVFQELERRGLRVERLDGDSVRDIFPTGFTRPERDAHVRRVGFLASRLERHGVFVVASLISPYAESRGFVRQLCRNFIEVYVDTPLEECERRDVKGLYGKARRGAIQNFTGLDDPYEPPAAAEVVLDTRVLSPVEAAARVVDEIARRAPRGR